MCDKVFLGPLLVGFQGNLEYSLEARGSFGYGWCLGHGRDDDSTGKYQVVGWVGVL